jgi:hypothetical protein
MKTQSTTHGIGPLLKQKYIFFKVMWIIFFLVSASLCTWMVIQSILEFMEFKVTTNIELVNDKDAYFPSVSICSKLIHTFFEFKKKSKIIFDFVKTYRLESFQYKRPAS